MSGILAEIRWSFVFQIPEKFVRLILSDRSWIVHIPLVRVVKFKLLAQFLVDNLPTLSCLLLYSFCASFLHSLNMLLIVSSLLPHNLYLLFCCVLSILALIWLFLMALFFVAIRRDSVSLLRFPFLSNIHVFSWEMSLVSRIKRPVNCFSSHFCFLVISVLLIFGSSVLFLVTVISLPPRFSL